MSFSPIQIGSDSRKQIPIGFGASSFRPHRWSGDEDTEFMEAMECALEHGITHFDTASGYGNGYSESMIGKFIAEDSSRREKLYIASKVTPNEFSARSMLTAIDASRERLQVDVIDLYYIHWYRTGKDMRPWMEGLETARAQGKIQSIGVSNFSIKQMEQLSEVGRIDAHQMGYSLLWRFPEIDLIPYCVENGIAVITYSSLAHGILTGKFGRELTLAENDQRRTILHFREGVWEHMLNAVDAFKEIAEQNYIGMIDLALRWLLQRPGVDMVLAGARNREQMMPIAHALEEKLPDAVIKELNAISDEAMPHIPDERNPFGYFP